MQCSCQKYEFCPPSWRFPPSKGIPDKFLVAQRCALFSTIKTLGVFILAPKQNQSGTIFDNQICLLFAQFTCAFASEPLSNPPTSATFFTGCTP
jgi:hypothetical protein